ncbi:EAL domain-containing protein [Altererythrobacter sp. GH1-8]|uniref:EAL domain-containing protein n=1 Tax=Altererythrobacter sp. GH1-8 TaxID=3349333 RepID=UPI00374CE089
MPGVSKSLTSLLVAAGAAMVALTSLAMVGILLSLEWIGHYNWAAPVAMVACSSVASLLVMSHLNSELVGWKERNAIEARTDPLTSLLNRKAMVDTVKRKSKEASSQSVLVFLDLDRFKHVNDTLGHDAGDALLKKVAFHLVSRTSFNEVFRLGGDEFALVLENCSVDQAVSTCLRLHREIARIHDIGEGCAEIGCSFGIAEIDGLTDPADVMRRADLAMYKAKNLNLWVQVFDHEMLEQSMRDTDLAIQLERSLADRKGLSLEYQPIVSRSFAVVALEGLLRWHTDEYGSVGPREALTIARRTRQTIEISLFVARQACLDLRNFPDLIMCINVEASQISDHEFRSEFRSLIGELGYEPCHFQLEFEEADLIANKARLTPVLQEMSDAGFVIAADNYGSSNSSLSVLRSMGVSAVKLDSSILHEARAMQSIAVLRAKVNLASSLGVTVTCKGIMDQEDEQIALQSGCDFLQGFRYGHPGDAQSIWIGTRPRNAIAQVRSA